MTDNVRTTGKDTFQSDVTEASNPVLVDFYADWCGPCKAVQPIVEETAADFADRIDTFKVNVDRDAELAQQFGIRGIPALILFKDGQPVETIVGLTTKSKLADTIGRHA